MFGAMGVNVPSQLPNKRLITVSVGNTASQIMNRAGAYSAATRAAVGA